MTETADERCTHPQLTWAEFHEGDWPRYRSQFGWKVGERLRCTSCDELLTVTLLRDHEQARTTYLAENPNYQPPSVESSKAEWEQARTDKALAGLAREARDLGPHFQGCHANPGNHWAAERCTCGWTDWLDRLRAITRDAPKEVQG